MIQQINIERPSSREAIALVTTLIEYCEKLILVIRI